MTEEKPDKRTKAQLRDEIDRLNLALKRYAEQRKEAQAVADAAFNGQRELQRALDKEQKKHEETRKELRTEKGRCSNAISAADEACTAAGIANRVVIRLMDQNDMLTNDMTRIAEGRPRR